MHMNVCNMCVTAFMFSFLFAKCSYSYITQNRIISRLVPYGSLSSTHEYLRSELYHLKNKKISNGLRNNKTDV